MVMLRTYEDTTTRKPDIVEVIQNLSPTETVTLSTVGRVSAKATMHEFMRDELAARGDNAVVEGADPSYGTLSSPQRDINITQILSKPYQISKTMQAVDTYGYDDRKAYESGKALKELTNDVNHAMHRGSIASGNSSTARRMAGMLNCITTNGTTAASGASLTEATYNSLLQEIYDQGAYADTVLVGARLKRTISAFVGAATSTAGIMDDATRKARTLAVDMYESDFGKQKILLERDALQGASSINSLVAIEKARFRAAWLTGRQPQIQKLAQTGDADNEQWITECTLEYGNEKAGGKLLGFLG